MASWIGPTMSCGKRASTLESAGLQRNCEYRPYRSTDYLLGRQAFGTALNGAGRSLTSKIVRLRELTFIALYHGQWRPSLATQATEQHTLWDDWPVRSRSARIFKLASRYQTPLTSDFNSNQFAVILQLQDYKTCLGRQCYSHTAVRHLTAKSHKR
jgi:hypothetical protein